MASTVDEFYASTVIPDNYSHQIKSAEDFVAYSKQNDIDIAFVTSGGTTVPLESKTIRYIDNFSVGTRGAVSAEYFLRNGYAVLFLHRKGSLEPFKRHFANQNFLDFLEKDNESESLKVKTEHLGKVQSVFGEYERIKTRGSLLQIQFTTLHDYLQLLRGLTQVLNAYEKRVIFYLAAAVSDFHIPLHDMPEHKIQSSDGPLNLTLHLVPKVLRPLVAEWAPSAFTVSFKLETDPAILIAKARSALEKYQHQLVIANILETRKQEVVLVTRDDSEPITLTTEQLKGGVEIEEYIIKALKERHSIFKEK